MESDYVTFHIRTSHLNDFELRRLTSSVLCQRLRHRTINYNHQCQCHKSMTHYPRNDAVGNHDQDVDGQHPNEIVESSSFGLPTEQTRKLASMRVSKSKWRMTTNFMR
ncbi:hypothetical protein QCA50_013594 [Cerrena zonata]|uniref:Uncharacterized protein n=1 Tax=Cerrena zonata TaxID=2478898 RepID=A0AAW0FTA8_9APHY